MTLSVTGATSTETTTGIVTSTGSTSGTGSGERTPWGWIAVAAALAVAAVSIGAWALRRRGAARKNFRAQARQATVDGTALHDGAVVELIAASLRAVGAGRGPRSRRTPAKLSASLQRLEADHQVSRRPGYVGSQVESRRTQDPLPDRMLRLGTA